MTRDEMIAAIYAAAAEPDGLSRMAATLRLYFDVDSAGVWFIEDGEVAEMCQTEDLASSIRPYLDYYQALDPWRAASKTPGQAYLGYDSVDEAELVRTEFYQDFARHYGMLRPMGLVTPLEPRLLATFALNRTSTSRLLGEPDRALLQELEPHLRGALMLRGQFLAQRKAIAARDEALDAIACGIVVCEVDGAIIEINEAAQELAALRQGLAPTPSRGKVTATTAPDTRALRGLVSAAVLSGQPGAMRLQEAGGGAVSAVVTPARGGAKGPGGRAIIHLRRDAVGPATDAITLARLFGLSPAQAELCLQLLLGRTFEEAAAERGVATSTARSHFAVILQRTGARNLRDLLRLLGALPSLRR